MKRSLILLVAFYALLCGCAHDHEDPQPTLPTVTIAITKPTENQQFHQGDTIFFKATITADTLLHGWGISLKRRGDDSLVYAWTNHYHTKSYEINQYFVNLLNQDTSLVFQLDAAINHAGDIVSKSVFIQTRKQ